MKINIYVRRHSVTNANVETRYAGGRTDEPLNERGLKLAESKKKDFDGLVFASPMTRCIQTAGLIYGKGGISEKSALDISNDASLNREKFSGCLRFVEGLDIGLIEDFREVDFGVFENQPDAVLKKDPRFIEWMKTGGEIGFPDGEQTDTFKERIRRGLYIVTSECERANKDAALITHGGVVMGMLGYFAKEKRPLYKWHIQNTEGYRISIDTEEFSGERFINVEEFLE